MKKKNLWTIAFVVIIIIGIIGCGDKTEMIPSVFTVSFNANGAIGTAPSAQTVFAGSSITLPDGSGLFRTGYFFNGWNTNSTGIGTNYYAGSLYTVTGNITLYANWAFIPAVSGTYGYTGSSGVIYEYTFRSNGTYTFKQTAPGVSSVSTDGTYTVSGNIVYLSNGNYVTGSTVTIVGPNTIRDQSFEYTRWGDIEAPLLIEPEMVYVPGGSFQMGKELGTAGSDAYPVHTVTLSSFYIGKYPVTQAQYQAVIGTNPSHFSSSPASGEVQGNRPVEGVSWYDAIVFCNRLSIAEGLSPAYRISGSTNPSDWGTVPTSTNSTWMSAKIVSGSNGYRLPTEAQWELAAKGGNGTPGNYTYSGSNNVDEVAWYNGNSDSKTHEVGKKKPNGLGLYDMSGNVWDWYGSYTSGLQTGSWGGSGSDGVDRAVRGGNWYLDASIARSVSPTDGYPSDRSGFNGFRLVRP